MITGDNVARLRRVKGWTQARLAELTGLSFGYIAAIEEGRRYPSVKALAIIAAVLGVEIEALCNKEGPQVEGTLEEQGILMLSNSQYLFFIDGKIYLIQDLTT